MLIWQILKSDLDIVLIFKSEFKHVKLKHTDHADYDFFHAALVLLEHLDSTLLRYLCDEADPHSVISTLHRACLNARALQDVIPDETLVYIRMARTAMDAAAHSAAAEVELQWVLDDIMAFRGSCCEYVEDKVGRNVINTGTSVERLTLYLRLGYSPELRRKELSKLLNRAYKSQLTLNQCVRNRLIEHVLNKETPTMPVSEQLQCVENLVQGL